MRAKKVVEQMPLLYPYFRSKGANNGANNQNFGLFWNTIQKRLLVIK